MFHRELNFKRRVSRYNIARIFPSFSGANGEVTLSFHELFSLELYEGRA